MKYFLAFILLVASVFAQELKTEQYSFVVKVDHYLTAHDMHNVIAPKLAAGERVIIIMQFDNTVPRNAFVVMERTIRQPKPGGIEELRMKMQQQSVEKP